MELIRGYSKYRIARRERPIPFHSETDAVRRPGRALDGEDNVIERAACKDARDEQRSLRACQAAHFTSVFGLHSSPLQAGQEFHINPLAEALRREHLRRHRRRARRDEVALLRLRLTDAVPWKPSSRSPLRSSRSGWLAAWRDAGVYAASRSSPRGRRLSSPTPSPRPGLPGEPRRAGTTPPSVSTTASAAC